MTDLTKATVADNGNIIMPKMRMVYASLFTPTRPSKRETDPKRFHWSTTGLIPAGSDLTALEQRIQEVFEANVPEAKRKGLKWKNPLLRTADAQSLAGYADEYPFLIRPNAKHYTRSGQVRPKPDVIDAKGREIKEENEPDELYNGRWFRCSLNPYWFDNDDAGISLGLVNVQVLGHAEPIAGGKPKATSEFEAVDGELDDLEDEMAGLE